MRRLLLVLSFLVVGVFCLWFARCGRSPSLADGPISSISAPAVADAEAIRPPAAPARQPDRTSGEATRQETTTFVAGTALHAQPQASSGDEATASPQAVVVQRPTRTATMGQGRGARLNGAAVRDGTPPDSAPLPTPHHPIPVGATVIRHEGPAPVSAAPKGVLP